MDSFLRHKTNKIDNIDFVLGVDYSRLILRKDIIFGKDFLHTESKCWYTFNKQFTEVEG